MRLSAEQPWVVRANESHLLHWAAFHADRVLRIHRVKLILQVRIDRFKVLDVIDGGGQNASLRRLHP